MQPDQRELLLLFRAPLELKEQQAPRAPIQRFPERLDRLDPPSQVPQERQGQLVLVLLELQALVTLQLEVDQKHFLLIL